ncbi:MAG: hypothetical protein NWE78_01210 [Candidatus Bathyarchaeota archaeon]|nr:hypothetical protein [Candidatus Bathyarchaeota archaeon]
MKHEDSLNAILVEAVNEGLSNICGSAGSAVIFFLENNGSIKSKTKIGSVESLSEGLESIFGFGSKVIERRILEVLYLKLQLSGKKGTPSDFDFVNEVKKAFKLSVHGSKSTRTRQTQVNKNGIEFGLRQLETSGNVRE